MSVSPLRVDMSVSSTLWSYYCWLLSALIQLINLVFYVSIYVLTHCNLLCFFSVASLHSPLPPVMYMYMNSLQCTQNLCISYFTMTCSVIGCLHLLFRQLVKFNCTHTFDSLFSDCKELLLELCCSLRSNCTFSVDQT